MPRANYFAYLGPNRRSDLRLVEIRLDFSESEAQETGFEGFARHIAGRLKDAGILPPGTSFPGQPAPQDRMEAYARLLIETALLFQRSAGHRVGHLEVRRDTTPRQYLAFMEHEHSEVGLAAMKVALDLFHGRQQQLRRAFREFLVFARARALSLETEAIILAARRRGIPWMVLDRQHFWTQKVEEKQTVSRGLLQLGQGAASRRLSGTYCFDNESDRQRLMLGNREARREFLREFGATASDEKPPGARTFCLLVIGGQFHALDMSRDSGPQPVEVVHESLHDLAMQLQEGLNGQAVNLILRGPNLDQPVTGAEVKILDFQLAPDLGVLFGNLGSAQEGPMAEAADQLVAGLFPDAAAARIPNVAITGTNGKTTTSRMVGHIFEHAGLKPCLACTLGGYVSGRKLSTGDWSSLVGHSQLLTLKNVESAILETHHRGIAVRGFVLAEFDVAVCLNVSGDHLAPAGIATMKEMTEVKRALVERAGKAAILFADDRNCLGMLDYLSARRIWLISLEKNVGQLRGHVKGRKASFCVLESIGGDEWLVVHHCGERTALLPSHRIPASFDGAARFMVSNAMHAAAAAIETGVSIEVIKEALSGFQADREIIQGRLNVYDNLPFRVIVDNAHNPDGLKQLMKLVDRQHPAGRKVLSFAGPHGRMEQTYRDMAKAVAGHCDLYFCNDRMPKGDAPPDNYAPILRDELLAQGIPPGQVRMASRGREAWEKIFEACGPGDLLILLLSPVEFDDVHAFIESKAQAQDL